MAKLPDIQMFERPIVGTYTYWESGELMSDYRGQGHAQVLVVGETTKQWWFAYNKEQLQRNILHSARKAILMHNGHSYCRLKFDVKAIKYAKDVEEERHQTYDDYTRRRMIRNRKRAKELLEEELKRYSNDTNPEIAQMARDTLASKDYQSFFDYMNRL